MRVTLKYFGLLAEITHCNEEQLELNANATTLFGLKNTIENRFPAFQKTAYSMALNQSLSNEEVELKEADVIAFLPPFAGG
nr:MoaD/ThiS family protein [uncultured Flavobacterium sp.]